MCEFRRNKKGAKLNPIMLLDTGNYGHRYLTVLLDSTIGLVISFTNTNSNKISYKKKDNYMSNLIRPRVLKAFLSDFTLYKTHLLYSLILIPKETFKGHILLYNIYLFQISKV